MLSVDHELVASDGVWPLKFKLLEPTYEVAPLTGRPPAHASALCLSQFLQPQVEDGQT